MAAENLTGGPDFVEVVDTNTSIVQRVPREWLDDPRLGRFIQRTNAQLALDHELPAPPSDATKADLVKYAASAGVDTEACRTKADIEAALAPYLATAVDEAHDDSDNPSEENPNPTSTPADGDKE